MAAPEMPEPHPGIVGSQFAIREDTVAQKYRSQQRTEVEEVAHLLLRQREQLNRSLGHLRLDALDVSLMEKKDIQYLNEYHKAVYEKISPYLTEEEAAWLKEATREV